ncbi:MAG: hypothetical protein AAGB03_02555 [Pseudomonadota bacterium]
MADEQLTGPSGRDASGRFVAGHRLGGRPLGARNRLGAAFLQALQDDFDDHGEAAIAAVRSDKPLDYLKIIASILPKDLAVSIEMNEAFTDDDLDREIRKASRALGYTLLEATPKEPVGGESDAQGA